ncbi:MAG: transcription termination/antitermination protein NusG, partial [Candidatus Binatia bacterium]
ADLEQRERALRYTPGVRDFLRSAGAPQVVMPDIIATLRDRIGPSGVYAPPPRRFAPGSRLRIEDGPLRGLEVVFERELTSADRVAVLLTEMELSARVVLPRHLLSAA